MKKILPLLLTVSLSILLQSGQYTEAADNQTNSFARTQNPIQIAELIPGTMPILPAPVQPVHTTALPNATHATSPVQTTHDLRRQQNKVVSPAVKNEKKKAEPTVASTKSLKTTKVKASKRTRRLKRKNRVGGTKVTDKKKVEEDVIKSVSLTFDDGPSPVYTAKVLAILKREHIHATFCLIGRQVKKYPELVQQIVAEGHQVADHSMNHDEHLDQKSDAKNKLEILGTKALIESIVPGTTVEFYRAPAGNINHHQKELLAEWGMKPLGWSVDTKDWQRPGVDEIMAHVNAQVHPGGVILMHDAGGDRSESVEALDKIITKLKNDGYQFVFPGEKPVQQVASK